MKISQPVSNYISKSLLTTQGDLLYQGAAAASRLGIGSAYDVLRSSGSVPLWVQPYIIHDRKGNRRFEIRIYNIGDWDMDADANAYVAHGLTHTKIVFAQAWIRRDDDVIILPINNYDTTDIDGILTFDSTNFNLSRRTGGTFDSGNFDATSFNRGWVTAIVLI